MTKKDKLDLMGEIVTVTHIYERSLNNKKVTWKKVSLPYPRAGWIVGFKTIQEGEIIGGSYFGYDGGYEPGFLDAKKHIPCLEVAFWTSMNPVRIPMDCWTIGGTPESPSRYNQVYNEKFREEMRWVMRDAKRDKNGRWL